MMNFLIEKNTLADTNRVVTRQCVQAFALPTFREPSESAKFVSLHKKIGLIGG